MKLTKFHASKTKLTIGGETCTPDFPGTGGALCLIGLKWGMLHAITLMIYDAWARKNLLEFQIRNTEFFPETQPAKASSVPV